MPDHVVTWQTTLLLKRIDYTIKPFLFATSSIQTGLAIHQTIIQHSKDIIQHYFVALKATKTQQKFQQKYANFLRTVTVSVRCHYD